MAGGSFPSEFIGEPSGVRFTLQTPESLYEAAAAAQSGELAYALLPPPLQSVTASMESDGSTFELKAKIDYAAIAKDALASHELIQKVVERLQYRDAVKIDERGSNFITRGYATNFVIGKHFGFGNGLTISTGGVDDGGRRVLRLLARPQVEAPTFHPALINMLGIISIATSIVYSHAKNKSPEELIAIGPPKPNKDNKSTGVLDKIVVERPNVEFGEIGGQDEAKREIMGLAAALADPEAYKRWGTKPPKGILLYGPPGTGKTLMARALASQAQARFFHVQASDIGSKWYGESEKIMQDIFDAASTGGKTIIYFDEVDAISPNRQEAHEATRRVVSTILQNIDGLGASDNVLLVASTNLINEVDSALLRPGRFDRKVYVGLPSQVDRTQILNIHLRHASELAGRELSAKSLDLSAVASNAENLSGADLAEIVRRALEDKVRLEAAGKRPGLLTTKDLSYQLSHYERVHRV